jgi:hypothetical protein
VLVIRAALLAIADRLTTEAEGIAPLGAGGSGAAASRQDTADHVTRARRALPRPVPGAQAEGRWLGPGGDTTVIRSGRGDVWHDRAVEFAGATQDPAQRRARTLGTHMEVKMAMRMRDQGLTQETIVVDRPVCGRLTGGRFTCHRQLPWFLPAGTTLTVVERDGTVSHYQGRSTA